MTSCSRKTSQLRLDCNVCASCCMIGLLRFPVRIRSDGYSEPVSPPPNPKLIIGRCQLATDRNGWPNCELSLVGRRGALVLALSSFQRKSISVPPTPILISLTITTSMLVGRMATKIKADTQMINDTVDHSHGWGEGCLVPNATDNSVNQSKPSEKNGGRQWITKQEKQKSLSRILEGVNWCKRTVLPLQQCLLHKSLKKMPLECAVSVSC